MVIANNMWKLLGQRLGFFKSFFSPVLRRHVIPPSEIAINGALLKADVTAFEHFLAFNATGASVWPATHVLAKYIVETEAVQRRIADGKVLEVGSGLGLLGLATAVLGARSVCLTDRLVPRLVQPVTLDEIYGEQQLSAADAKGGEQQLNALRTTLAANRSTLPAECSVIVEELAFGDTITGQHVLHKHGPFDLVLGSDVSYLSAALPDLASTLQQVAGRDTLVLLGHNCRRKGLEKELLGVLEGAGFAISIQKEDRAGDGVIVLECSKI